MIRFFISDIQRAVCSWRFVLSVFGIALTMYLFGMKVSDGYTMVEAYQLNICCIQVLLVFVFSIFPFGEGICQDLEYGFHRVLIIRGKLKNYVYAKELSIFLSTVFAMILGTLFYILMQKIEAPNAIWIKPGVNYGSFSYLLEHKMYLLYMTLCGLKMGCLAGILSVTSAFVSLYITNRLLVYTLPIIAFYTIDDLSQVLFYPYNFDYWFNPTNTLHDNDFVALGMTLLVAAALLMLIAVFMLKRMQRRLSND